MIVLQTRLRMEERASMELLHTTASVEQGLLMPTVKTVKILVFRRAVVFLISLFLLIFISC